MTADKLARWLIAELKANAGVRSAMGSPVLVARDNGAELSATGLYVGVESDSREQRWADSLTARVTVFATGADRAAALANAINYAAAVDAALLDNAGSPRVWSANPAASGLRLRSIVRTVYQPPELPVDPKATSAQASIVYRVRGSDTARAS